MIVPPPNSPLRLLTSSARKFLTTTTTTHRYPHPSYHPSLLRKRRIPPSSSFTTTSSCITGGAADDSGGDNRQLRHGSFRHLHQRDGGEHVMYAGSFYESPYRWNISSQSPPLHLRRRIRPFTTTTTTTGSKNDKDGKKSETGERTTAAISSADKNSEQDEDDDSNTTTTMDPEFAAYLTGNDTKDGFTDSSPPSTPLKVQPLPSPKLPPSPTAPPTTTGFEWFNTLLTDTSTNLAPLPPSSSLHRPQTSTHNTNAEKQRANRVSTVRRALVGNLFIAAIKLAAFLHSGSSALKAEFVHSVVDCGNQSLLLIGLRDSGNKADRAHPYGYGKSIYFWALVSALGTFWLGAGVSMTQSIPELIHGPSLEEITWHLWGVLGVSFLVDGYVLTKTMLEIKESMPPGADLWKHVYRIRDPAILAILLEDGAACLGVLMAISGIGLSQYMNDPIYDALAGVGISGLLAAMGVVLVRVNHRFLLGQAVDRDIVRGIQEILTNRPSIDHVASVQSQWTGPETFSYKAEVDFDGTFLAAKLMPRYQQEFAEAHATLDQDLRVLLSWYAEDVMRTVEREVREIEAEIRRNYPGAQFIELEPMGKDADRYAIDDGMEAQLKRIETEALNRYLKRLYQDRGKAGGEGGGSGDGSGGGDGSGTKDI